MKIMCHWNLKKCFIACILCISQLVFASAKCPRVVTLSPALTELQYQLGKGACLVAASEFSDYPKDARQLPRVGGLFSPSIEKIFISRPDWVLLDAFTSNPSIEEALGAAGIKTLKVRIASVESLFSESRKILKEVYAVEHSSELDLWLKLWSQLKKRKVKGTFLFLTWLEPTIAATSNTFFADLIIQLGGVHLLSSKLKMPYPSLSREWLTLNSPDNLFLLLEDSTRNPDEITRFILSSKWKREPNVFVLPASYFSRTTFSALQGMAQLKGL